jgi:hypothetical protein
LYLGRQGEGTRKHRDERKFLFLDDAAFTSNRVDQF